MNLLVKNNVLVIFSMIYFNKWLFFCRIKQLYSFSFFSYSYLHICIATDINHLLTERSVIVSLRLNMTEYYNNIGFK